MPTRDATLQPKGFQMIAAQDATTPGLLTVPSGAGRCLIKCETQAIRWKDDTGLPGATAVSATEGMLLDIGDEFLYVGQLKALRFIATSATSKISISYYA